MYSLKKTWQYGCHRRHAHWQRVKMYCRADTIWKLSGDRRSNYMEEHSAFCGRELCIKLYQLFLFLFQMASKECSNLSTEKSMRETYVRCYLRWHRCLRTISSRRRSTCSLCYRPPAQTQTHSLPICPAISSPSVQKDAHIQGVLWSTK